MLPDKFEFIRRKIAAFVQEYPLATIVVSCRTNFYTSFGDDANADTLKDFRPYRLQTLDSGRISDYLSEKLKHKTDPFIKEVSNKELGDLLGTPYYLIRLSQQYNLNGKISNSKADLFREEIKLLVNSEVRRRFGRNVDSHRDKLFKELRKLAFVMEAMGTNQVNTIELYKIIPHQGEAELIKDSASIFYGTEDQEKLWRFNHHNMQEFLAADVLSKKKFGEIKKIIAIGPDYRVAKPLMVNTILFLIDILPNNDTLKRDITNWLVAFNKELLIKLEPDRLNNSLRESVFREIFKEYKKEGRRINSSRYRSDDLARFSQGVATFQFLLEELKESSDTNNLTNALSIINYYNLNNYPEYLKRFKVELQKILFGNRHELYYLAINAYALQCRLSTEEFDTLFNTFHSSKDEDIRLILFEAVLIYHEEEHRLSYLIAEVNAFMKEELDNLRSGNKRSYLTSGGAQMAKWLSSIKSVEGLTTIFTGLEKYILALDHSGAFSKTLQVLLEHAASWAGKRKLQQIIIDIFKGHPSEILHEIKLKKYFMEYFNSLGLVEEIAADLLLSLRAHDSATINAISHLATSETIDLLKSKKQSSIITDDTIASFEFFS